MRSTRSRTRLMAEEQAGANQTTSATNEAYASHPITRSHSNKSNTSSSRRPIQSRLTPQRPFYACSTPSLQSTPQRLFEKSSASQTPEHRNTRPELSRTPSSPVFDLPIITHSPQTLHHDDPSLTASMNSTHSSNFDKVKQQGRSDPLIVDKQCCGFIRLLRRLIYSWNLETAIYMLEDWERFLFNSVLVLMTAFGVRLFLQSDYAS